MARINCSFNVIDYVNLTFDSNEFKGLSYGQIRDSIRGQLPGNVDPDDIDTAAYNVYFAIPVQERGSA